jgi:hypothetical protein
MVGEIELTGVMPLENNNAHNFYVLEDQQNAYFTAELPITEYEFANDCDNLSLLTNNNFKNNEIQNSNYVCENVVEWGVDFLFAERVIDIVDVNIGQKTLDKIYDVYIGDIRLDPLVSLTTKQFFQEVRIHTRMTSSVFNAKISTWYPNPPFQNVSTVSIFDFDQSFLQFNFVHMYNKEIKGDNIVGQFFALEGDVKGLTSQEMKDLWDLPHLPTHIADVNPPLGTKAAVGIVQKGNFGGKGKATQYFFIDKAEDRYFSNGVTIDEFNQR